MNEKKKSFFNLFFFNSIFIILGEPSIAEMLISITKCSLNTVDNRGFSALHYACLSDNIECVSLLLKLGAHPYINSLNELLPSDLTKNNEIKKIISQVKEENDLSIDETDNISVEDKNLTTISEEDENKNLRLDEYGFSGKIK